MPLRPGLTLDIMNGRGKGRLPGLFGLRVMAMEKARAGIFFFSVIIFSVLRRQVLKYLLCLVVCLQR